MDIDDSVYRITEFSLICAAIKTSHEVKMDSNTSGYYIFQYIYGTFTEAALGINGSKYQKVCQTLLKCNLMFVISFNNGPVEETGQSDNRKQI